MNINSRGFTMTEMAITMGISAFLTVILAITIEANTRAYNGTVSRLDAQDSLNQVEELLKRTARQALLVDPYIVGGVQPEGWIRSFCPALSVPPCPEASVAGSIFQWGMFWREVETNTALAPVAHQGKTLNTGLFYLPPNSAGPKGPFTQGVIFIDYGVNYKPYVVDTVYPNYSGGSFVGNIVDLQVLNLSTVAVPPTSTTTFRVLSADISVQIRYFLPTTPSNQRCWLKTGCPTLDVGHDETRIFTIYFRNNDLGNSPLDSATNELRGMGSVYFFQEYGAGVTL